MVQTAFTLVGRAIFHGDLLPEQHAYRADHSAHSSGGAQCIDQFVLPSFSTSWRQFDAYGDDRWKLYKYSQWP